MLSSVDDMTKENSINTLKYVQPHIVPIILAEYDSSGSGKIASGGTGFF